MTHSQNTLKIAKLNQKYAEKGIEAIKYCLASLFTFAYRLIYGLSPLKPARNRVFGCFKMVDRQRVF